MNPRLTSLLAASFLALTSLSYADAPKKKLNASPILAGPPEKTYGRGTPRAQVVAVLGAPSHVLSADLWVYFNFRGDDPSVDPALDTLVIAFANDKVAEMKLAEYRVVRRVIDTAKAKAKVAATPAKAKSAKFAQR